MKPPALKRQPPPTRDAGMDPVDVLYAALGYMGVLYEAQLVYVKQGLEKAAASNSGDDLVATLGAMHSLAVDACAQMFAGQPLDEAALREVLQANGRVVTRLAAEGREFLSQVLGHRSR
jgi:hypothetical protein